MTPTAVTSSAPSPFAVFRNRSFSLMWTGQLISTIGSALTSLAASIYVYHVTNSALSVGLMLMATAAPTILVGLIAGVFVDRYDRKKIMIAADLIRAVLVFLLPILLPVSIVWLYVIVALSSAVGQFFEPAYESLLPEIATDAELAAANSFIAISSFGATAIGFAASGLIGSQNVNIAFWVDAVSFLLSAFCILLIKFPKLAAQEATTVKVVLRNLKAGAKFLINSPMLRSLFIVSIPLFVSFGLANSLLLPFAKNALHATESQYGLQEGLTSIGFVVGSLLMARLTERLREGQWIAISIIGMALAGIGYSLMVSIPIAIGIQMASGLLNAPSSVGRRLIVQRNTPREMRGRVNSAFAVSRDVMFLFGMAAAGLADVIDVRIMYLIASLILLGSGALSLIARGLGQPAAEWRRAMTLLRTAPSMSGLGLGRAALLADMDKLVGLLPSLSTLSAKDRSDFVAHSIVNEAPAGTTIIRVGEQGDTAFFILSGRVVAGLPTPDGGYRGLSALNAGDFFGEIAALTGAARTANIVADEPTTVLQVPAKTMRALMTNAQLSQLFLSKITERLSRTSVSDLPRFAGYDQQSLRDLRTAPAAES
ncbi:MAG TPA: MFS transporter [Anaerolineae bacterium]|nr:MFS transporter [Anaerolineae bacterium]